MKRLTRIAVITAVALIAGACSQSTAPPAPTRPDQILTMADAEQAVDYLAMVVEQQDFEASKQILARHHGDAEDTAAVLLAFSDQVPAWLRGRRLISETEACFVFELSSFGSLRAHKIHVHKHTPTTEGVDDE